MNRLILLLGLILIFKLTYGQDFKAIKTIHKYSDKITEIATCDNYFATESYDRTVTTWDYSGKRMFKYTISEGSINALCFLPGANSLLVAISEFNNDGYSRYIIKQFDMSGKIIKEFVDATMNQEQVNMIYLENNTGTINAVINASKIYPELNLKSNLAIPQVKDKLSHQETIQDIKVSPNQQIIASIDKYNYLKIWRASGRFIKSFQIKNNKKDTYIYFLSDTTLLVTPNIILNIENNNSHKIVGFEEYMATPLANKIYFSFDYNKHSKSEKLFDRQEMKLKDIELGSNNSLCVTTSNDKFGLLGVDGLIRILNTNGDILSVFGKDKDEERQFWDNTIHVSSEINRIKFSPNGEYLISGDKNGKVIIWRNEK